MVIRLCWLATWVCLGYRPAEHELTARCAGHVKARPGRPFAVAPARHRKLAQEQTSGVSLTDRRHGHYHRIG